MNIELINTGSELMLGFVLNTHQQWLCRQLTDRGYTVARQVAVADHGPTIQQAVREALARADVILTTGGLGPTSDDLTRDLIAQLLGRRLREDPATVAHIEKFLSARCRPMTPSVRVQALVPEGATVLPNNHGTAPGLVLELDPNPYRAGHQRALLIMLPGPPRELRPMFTDQVAPLLQQKFPAPTGFICRTFKTTGLGESAVEEKIAQPLAPLLAAGLAVGYCARVGEVEVRLTAQGAEAEAQIRQGELVLRTQIGDAIFGTDDDSLEAVVIRELAGRRRTLAVAESCTGGVIAHRLTNISGASQVFLGGLVTYSNAAKEKFLGVSAELLAQHGAVSEPVARAMAEGARHQTGADYALAVTGIAGPTGGTATKPVGTVFIALAAASGTTVVNPTNRYERETFKFVTSQQALELLRRALPGGAAGK